MQDIRNKYQKLIKNFTQHSGDSLFISFEGIEGSGKTTQIQTLVEKLKDYDCLVLREPGGTKLGEQLRSAILNSNGPITPLSEAYLFACSRAQLLEEKVLPHLRKPKSIVILDRYIDSSLSYQGIGRALGIDLILDIHKHPPLNILPHLSFYLDIDIETSMLRQRKRANTKDYFEKEDLDFYKKIIKGHELTCELFPKRIHRVNAKLEQVEVFNQIMKKLETIL